MSDELDRDLKNELYYPCTCHREITFDNVLSMGRVLTNETFALEWKCECALSPYSRYFRVEKGALRRLLSGLRPVLPYTAAERQALPLRPEQERLLTVFRWECQQLEGVEEFLLFASRPSRRALPESPE